MRISDWSSDVCSSDLSSESAHAAQAKRWVYPCTKAAIEELTRSQALDVAKDNIRVNAVIQGWTWSAPIKKAHAENPECVEQFEDQFNLRGRMASADKLAGPVLFLCSSTASLTPGTS